MIHGDRRNPVSTLDGTAKAAQAAGADGHTLIVAPFFKTDSDHPTGGEAVWTSDGWKDGNDSVKPSGLSSFTVMDELLTRLADKSRFPNLTRITVVGHSAGAQYTNRYAAAGPAPSALGGVAVDYVVATRYFTLMHAAFPNPPHTVVIVPAIAHNHYALFEFPQAKPILCPQTVGGASG